MPNNCFPTLAQVNRMLWTEHGMQVQAHGYVQEIATRLYLNKNEDTWAIVQTNPEGISCIRALGTNWATAPFESELVG